MSEDQNKYITMFVDHKRKITTVWDIKKYNHKEHKKDHNIGGT